MENEKVSTDQALQTLFGDDLKVAQAKINSEKSDKIKEFYQNFDTQVQAQETAQKSQGYGQSKLDQSLNKVADRALGAGLAVREVGKNIYNGVVGFADALENYAASKGVGSGDLISEANKWQDKPGEMANNNLGSDGKVAKAVVQYTAPLVATMGSGGSFAMGVGINAAYNFLAIDPKQERLADMVKDTWLHEVPVATQIIDSLKTKPSDTELESRFKNMIEGAGLDVGLGMTFYAANKVYNTIEKLRDAKTAKQAMVDLEKMSAEAKAQAQGIDVNAPVSSAEQQALNSSDVNISKDQAAIDAEKAKAQSDALQAEQLKFQQESALFDEEYKKAGLGDAPVSVQTDGTVATRIENDGILNYFEGIMNNNSAAVLMRGPISDAEVIKGAEILKNDPKILEQLASFDYTKATPNSEQTMVLKYVRQESINRLGALSDEAIKSGSAIDQVKFFRAMQNNRRITDIIGGTASEKGRAFRVEQILAKAANAGDKEALNLIGSEGRSKLLDKLVEAYGGKEKLNDMAKNVSFIKEMSAISKKPNEDFALRMGKVQELTASMKLEDALETVALNGMLASPATWGRATIGNIAMTGKTIVDNYVEAGLSSAFRVENGKTMAEANAAAKAALTSIFTSVRPAYKSFVTGAPINVHTVNPDFLAPTKKVLQNVTEGYTGKEGWDWVARTGIWADDKITRPQKVLMSVDTYFQKINRDAIVAGEAVREAASRGLQGEEFTKFVQDFSDNVPKNIETAAWEKGSVNTLANDLTGPYKIVNDALGGVLDKIPAGKVILPFTKTGLNSLKYTIDNSPLAIGKLLNKNTVSALKGPRTREQMEAIAKVTSGATFLAGATYLASEGLVSGSESANYEVQNALKGSDTVPANSIKVGDKWVSFDRIEPISTLLNAAHMMSKASGYMKAEEYDIMGKQLSMVLSDAASPEQLTSSLRDLMKAASSNDPASVPRMMADIASRFTPMSAGFRDISQTIDPVTRSIKSNKENYATDTFAPLKEFVEIYKNKLSQQVPFMSKDLPATRNMYGEVLILPDGIGPDSMSPLATSDGSGAAIQKSLQLMDEFNELHKNTNQGLSKIEIQMPQRSIQNPLIAGKNIADDVNRVNYTLTPKEYSLYMQAYGGFVNGKSLLKTQIEGVLKETGILGKELHEITQAQFLSAVPAVKDILMAAKKRANKTIAEVPDVLFNLQKQAREYNMFRGGKEFASPGGLSVGQ